MTKLLLLPLAVLFLNGCATHNADLKDISTDQTVTIEPTGAITTNTTTRSITTKLKGTTWFSSAQILEKFKALQTDKTQSVGAGTVSQQGATNTVGVIDATTGLLREVNKLKGL